MSHVWKDFLLGDVVNLKRGYDLPHRKRKPGSVPIVSSSGITDYHCEAKVKGPGVVTGRYGTIGKVFYLKQDYWPLNTSLYVQDFKGNDPLFIYFLLQTLNLDTQSVAAAVPGVNRNFLHMLPVRMPNLNVQRKIAAVLSAYDDLIENNTRRIQILEAMAQAIYREWFVHFRFPGHENTRMVETELGLVPAGWEVKKLSESVHTQYGYTASASEEEIGPKFVRGMDINKTSYIQWDSVPYCPITPEKHAKYKLNVGDIVVIRMANPGKVGIVEKDIDAVFASYLIRFHIESPSLSPYYLFYLLLSDRYQNYATGASTGTTRKSASAGVLTNIDIVIPPDNIRKQFEHHVIMLRQMLNNLLDKNANLRQTRDLLLPRLVSGRVEVAELDIDITRSLLL